MCPRYCYIVICINLCIVRTVPPAVMAGVGGLKEGRIPGFCRRQHRISGVKGSCHKRNRAKIHSLDVREGVSKGQIQVGPLPYGMGSSKSSSPPIGATSVELVSRQGKRSDSNSTNTPTGTSRHPRSPGLEKVCQNAVSIRRSRGYQRDT